MYKSDRLNGCAAEQFSAVRLHFQFSHVGIRFNLSLRDFNFDRRIDNVYTIRWVILILVISDGGVRLCGQGLGGMTKYMLMIFSLQERAPLLHW